MATMIGSSVNPCAGVATLAGSAAADPKAVSKKKTHIPGETSAITTADVNPILIPCHGDWAPLDSGSGRPCGGGKEFTGARQSGTMALL
jgi:hypothetical protein